MLHGIYNRRFQHPGVEIIGSSSHSEYCNDGYASGSVSMMAMDAGSVEAVCVMYVDGGILAYIGKQP